MDQISIMFYKESGIKSYAMTDLHILGYNTSFGYEDSDIMILMLIKYYYLAKVIMNILSDIMM